MGGGGRLAKPQARRGSPPDPKTFCFGPLRAPLNGGGRGRFKCTAAGGWPGQPERPLRDRLPG